MELSDFLNRITLLPSMIPQLYVKAASNILDELADLQVEQMEAGLLNTGSKMPDYSDDYEKFKGFKTPNLRLEGDFHSGVYVESKKDRLLYDSKDGKTNKLTGMYTDNIFGMSPKFIDKRNEHVDEYLKDEIDEYITQ